MSEFDETSSKQKNKVFSDFELESADNPQKIPPAVHKDTSPTNNESLRFETNEEEVLVKRRKKPKQQKSYIFFTSLLTAIIWVAGSLFYLMDQQALGQTTFDQVGMILRILGPAAFSLLMGLLGEALVRSGREARIFSVTAKKLLEVPDGVEDGSMSRLRLVRDEIDRLERALDMVNIKLGGIDDKISQKARELVAVSASAKEGADNLVSSLEGERSRLAAILDGLSELSKTTVNTTQLATQSINDNAGILNKAAEGLVERSNFASSQAALAANKLEEAMAKTLGVVTNLDEASLRGEQALARAHELLVLARVRSDDAVGGVSNAIEFLHAAAQNAAETAQKVSQLVTTETQNSRALSIKTIEDVRAIAEDSANQIMQGLRAEAENARLKAKEAVESFDQTNNAIRVLTEDAAHRAAAQFENIRQDTFEITANADKLVEKSVSNAKELIDASASILDDTGARIKARFSELANTSIDQARAIEDIINHLNDKLAQLPKEADERAKAIEIALEQTLQNLSQAGSKAAEEVRSLDDAFQTRLRASYNALGDVVGKLGSIPGISPGVEMPRREIEKKEEPVEVLPDPRKIINSEPSEEIAIPKPDISKQKPIENRPEPIAEEPYVIPVVEPPKPTVTPVVFDHKPIFDSVLSPRIPVRSAPIVNTQAPPSNPKPELNLRGTIGDSNPEPKPKVEEKPKEVFPNISVNTKPETENRNPHTAHETHDYENPFGDFKSRNNQANFSPNNWTWRDVLKSLDDTNDKKSEDLTEKILREHNLKNTLNDVVLDRFAQNYLHDFEKARNQIKMALPSQIAALRRQMSENKELRANLVKFVETRRETIKHSRVKGDDLRVYLFADAALSA